MVQCKTAPTQLCWFQSWPGDASRPGSKCCPFQLHPSRQEGLQVTLVPGIVLQGCSCCSEPEKLCSLNPICAAPVWFGFALLARDKFDVLCETNSAESKVWCSPAPSQHEARSVAQLVLLQFMVLEITVVCKNSLFPFEVV